MVRFSLFGIPVVIHPWFWLTMSMLGGLLNAAVPDRFLNMCLFMFAGTISILVHEFGHALTGRHLGGGFAHVELWAFGGLAYNEGGRFSRSQRFWMIAAGPGAGFLLGLLILGLVCLFFGPRDGGSLFMLSVFNIRTGFSESTAEFLSDRIQLFRLINHFLWINFWWGVMNLLPVHPLDGGQISELFVRSKKRVHQIAVAAAGSVVAFALWRGDLYLGLLFGYLCWRNIQAAGAPSWK